MRESDRQPLRKCAFNYWQEEYRAALCHLYVFLTISTYLSLFNPCSPLLPTTTSISDVYLCIYFCSFAWSFQVTWGVVSLVHIVCICFHRFRGLMKFLTGVARWKNFSQKMNCQDSVSLGFIYKHERVLTHPRTSVCLHTDAHTPAHPSHYFSFLSLVCTCFLRSPMLSHVYWYWRFFVCVRPYLCRPKFLPTSLSLSCVRTHSNAHECLCFLTYAHAFFERKRSHMRGVLRAKTERKR